MRVAEASSPLSHPLDQVCRAPLRVLALTKYGDKAASVRQRFLQFRSYLEREGFQLETSPLLDNSYLEKTFLSQRVSLTHLATCLVRRFRALCRQRRADILWVQKELFPFVPGTFERALLWRNLPMIFDYDDAIFHQYDQHRNPLVRKLLGRKLEPLLRSADLVICGNAYLRSYAEHFSSNVEIVPTVLDVAVYSPGPVQSAAGRTTIGWIGSPSTWKYVEPLVPLLREVAEELDLRVRIVGAGAGAPKLPRFEILDWSEHAEVDMIRGMDIGIMPLPDEPWARGKCGYKLIQYMACGLPVVASPVGVNTEIVEHGVNGFLADTHADWLNAIRRLVSDTPLRREMGQRGRAKVERAYSIQVHGPRLAKMFRQLALRTVAR